MSASWISRVRFEVMTTIGGCAALTVPSSGMVTWKSASTSSRNASNASSLRSSSSISSTGAPAGSGSSACSSGRLIRKRSENTSCWMRVAVVLASGLGGADRDHLRGVVPLVDRGRDVETLVALQPDQPAAERRRQHLGDLGLADAGLAFEEDRPAHLQRQEQHGRERPVGEIIRAAEQFQGGVDGSGDGVGFSESCGTSIAGHGRICPDHPGLPVMHRLTRECPAQGRASRRECMAQR